MVFVVELQDQVVEGVVDQVVHLVGFSVQVGQVVGFVEGRVDIGFVGLGTPSLASL